MVRVLWKRNGTEISWDLVDRQKFVTDQARHMYERHDSRLIHAVVGKVSGKPMQPDPWRFCLAQSHRMTAHFLKRYGVPANALGEYHSLILPISGPSAVLQFLLGGTLVASL